MHIVFEAMPDSSSRSGEPADDRPQTLSLWSDGSWRALASREPKLLCRRLIMLLLLLVSVFWPASLKAQRSSASDAGGHRFDIGIIIDNRRLPRSGAAKAEVNTLLEMLDRQMFIEHIMVFERPTIEVMCDVFGCPAAPPDATPFPPLLWQITREQEARLFVYYIGDGRAEGLERQLLFRRKEGGPAGDVEAFPVDWLHGMLEDAGPSSAVLMLDTSFSPRPLPCASEDPLLISDALLSVRQNYRNVMRDQRVRTDNLELSATTPVQPPHCDRFDQVLDGVEQPLFTKFLLKAIVEGEADLEPFGDDDRLVDLGELTDYLDDRINRAARFQWGRLQNVRAVGARSKVLAALDGRKLSPSNRDVVARRNRPPIQEEKPAAEGVPIADGRDQGSGDRTGAGPMDREAFCRADPTAAGCHPCVIDPGGKACAERCQGDGGSDLCTPNLFSTTEKGGVARMGTPAMAPGKAGVVAIEAESGFPAEDEIDKPSAACRWVIDNISPYTATLVQRIRGSTATSCDWATDRSEVELGSIAQIFTPIAWRLSRSSTQDALSCLLDCGSAVPAEEGAIPDEDNAPLDPPAPPALQTSTRRVSPTQIDPRSLSAFNREVCDRLDEPLPPYIGLPRWMPGTLIISEGLRAVQGCPPPPAQPELPTPLAVAIEAPPEQEAPTPAPSPPSAVPMAPIASADQRLSRWPPSTAGLDPRIADSTSVEGDGSTVEPEGLLHETLLDETLPIEKNFERSVSKVRWLQSALTVDNRDPGPIDGMIGEKTEAAIQSWRRDHERENRTGPLTEPEFQAIIRDFGERFGQIEKRVPSF